MEEEILNAQKFDELKPSADTLRVLNIHTNQVEMVKGVDKEGNLQKVLPQNMKSKNGKKFDAYIALKEDFSTAFEFRKDI